MANKRVSMRKLREILRLRWECDFTYEQISQSCGISNVSVGNYLARAYAAGLGWPLPADMDDNRLEDILFPKNRVAYSKIPSPDWSYLHDELQKKGVTKLLLWQEYKQTNQDGYQYSHFCNLYQDWEKKRKISYRHVHRAGEKLFVDFAGQTIPIMDRLTGAVREAQIFVAVMGASQYTYAEAVYSQDLPTWISCHVRAFEFFGGVTEIIVPDNLKSGVSKACRYDPELNPTYQEMAAYYGTSVIPARVRHPKDKARAEIGVCLVTRWILAALRKRTFYSLDELNEAIQKLLEKLNSRPFQKLDGTRKGQFEKLDRPVLKALPQRRYEYAEVKRARVNVDYHVLIDNHHYSVPYQLTREEVIVRLTKTAVEIIHKNRRIASHPRSHVKWGFTTIHEHRPKSHQKYIEWNAERFIRWAATIGQKTSEFILGLIASYEHEEQSYSRCLGVFRLGAQYGHDNLEAACGLANQTRQYSYQSLKFILKRGLYKSRLSSAEMESKPLHHCNIRGGGYYNN